MHPLPEHRENAERSQRSTAPLPRRSQSTTTTSVLSSDAADGRATCRSSSAAADLQAAGQPSGAAAADLRAPSPSSPADERAADSSQGAPAAAERGSVNPGLRRRQNANQPRSFPCVSPKWDSITQMSTLKALGTHEVSPCVRAAPLVDLCSRSRSRFSLALALVMHCTLIKIISRAIIQTTKSESTVLVHFACFDFLKGSRQRKGLG